MAKLSSEEIAQKLKSLPGWEYKDNAIAKMFKFKEFLRGIEFVQKVAEAADHHPDIHINYTRVTFICSTHASDSNRRPADYESSVRVRRSILL